MLFACAEVLIEEERKVVNMEQSVEKAEKLMPADQEITKEAPKALEIEGSREDLLQMDLQIKAALNVRASKAST